MKKLFIDKNIKVIKGIKAEKLIRKKNDSIYIENNAILKVDENRWLEAQDYEKKTWMKKGIRLSDDRNFEHFTRFDSYKSLKEINYNLIKVIELGCGPFTNMRTLVPLLPKLNEIHLLDPLLNDYLSHPNCQYKDGKFGKYETKLHVISIEDSEINEKFDLVMMINVLEHCYNIYRIFDQITNLLDVGGIFIFSDVSAKCKKIYSRCNSFSFFV